MTRATVRSRVHRLFDDPAKRGLPILVAMLTNLVVLLLGRAGVFDRAPTWVELVFFWGVELLVVLPLLITCAAFMIRDRRRRKRQQTAEQRSAPLR